MASTKSKILSPVSALAWRQRKKSAGVKVTFTNGVFDLLHPGHVELLEKAKALGGELLVAVNSDASVRRLGKGPERPLNPLQARQRVLAGLACVDAVTSFDEDTPELLLSKILPDIMVKGADYKKSQVAGRQHAKRVALIALKKGYSTTNIVKKLKK